MIFQIIFRLLSKLTLYIIVGGLVFAIITTAYVLFELHFGDYSQFTKEYIQKQISAETSVYYSNAKDKIGVFFSNQHRVYVPISEMPGHLLNALISAEDYYFYKHPGINPFSMIRAAIAIIQAGRIVQGGSTLTQQTAKNIFHRTERSFKAKFIEMVQALKLERRFSKKDILEFYLNQFHVVSNGRGIGIAARYYFNKEVKDLTLVESAFIAGSVKGPFKYDPHTKKTELAKMEAHEAAQKRKNWVLKRMLQNNTILEEEYLEAVDKEIPFNFSSFQYKSVSILDFVRTQLNRQEILDALGYDNVSQITNSGLRVITTLDAHLQKQAQFHVKRNLSRVEHTLKGFQKGTEEDFKELDSIYELEKKEFYYARILEINRDKTNPSIRISYGEPTGNIDSRSLKQLANNERWFIPYDQITKGLKREDIALERILNQIEPGDIVFTSIEHVDREERLVRARLEVKPEVEGGLIVIDKGSILALISGFSRHTYNRAVYAKRQPGSVFKPIVYYGALQLGWNLLDPLKNARTIHNLGSTFYYPKPDHPPQSEEVSMVWAGAKSENLATIYLLINLTEKLNMDEFRELASFVGMAQIETEKTNVYAKRIRDRHGIIMSQDQLKRYIFSSATKEILPDIIFESGKDLVKTVRTMNYGLGYASEIEEYTKQLDPEYVKLKMEEAKQNGEIPEDPLPEKEILHRIQALKNNFLRYNKLSLDIQKDLQEIYDFYFSNIKPFENELDLTKLVGPPKPKDTDPEQGNEVAPSQNENKESTSKINIPEHIQEILANYFVEYGQDGQLQKIAYFKPLPKEDEIEDLKKKDSTATLEDSKIEFKAFQERQIPGNLIALDIYNLVHILQNQEDNEDDDDELEALLNDDSTDNDSANNKKIASNKVDSQPSAQKPILNYKNIHVDGIMPLWVVEKIALYLAEKFDPLWAEIKTDLYSIESLSYHKDFRILLGLRYLIRLAKHSGIHSRLSPVLSFPLGTNEVTLAEGAKLYQTFLTGKIYSYYDNEKGLYNQLNIIKQIEDRNGNLLYKPTREEYQLVDLSISNKMFEILGKTMTRGTGRYHARKIAISFRNITDDPAFKNLRIKIPTYGKTGTTDDYTNSIFVGFVPYPTQKDQPLNPSNSYLIASYVGYDQNSRMVRKPVKITGARGALPVWATIANEIIRLNQYADFLDIFDLDTQRKGVYPTMQNTSNIGIRVNPKSGLFESILQKYIPAYNNFDSPTTPNKSYKSFNNVVFVQGLINGLEFQPLKHFALFNKITANPFGPRVKKVKITKETPKQLE